MFKYSINLAWSKEDECYVATVPEFPGLSAMGETPEKAAEEAKIAVDGFLEIYLEDGCEIPEPETVKDYSGQTRLRLPKSLHATLSKEAEREGISLNSYIVHLLSERNLGKKVEAEINKLRSEVLSQILLSGANKAVTAKTKSQNNVYKLEIDTQLAEA